MLSHIAELQGFTLVTVAQQRRTYLMNLRTKRQQRCKAKSSAICM